MIILGIDPGSRTTGYSVVDVAGSGQSVVEYGKFDVRSEAAHELRLLALFERISELIDRIKPDECAIEMPVYGKDPQAMLKLGRAQATAMLAALTRQIPVVQYTPKEVKKAVTGNGNASKQQVWFMVRSILSISDENDGMNYDVSDAIAVSLCHVHRGGRPSQKKGKGWATFIASNPDRIL
ncbi:MAG: crossover junction endodeoxyribonuclease RuvC [Rhodothermales bacterium]|nr:crossover junction endodeoxyribonuclease RuvC [Rhodothermales bacterium]